MKEQAKEHRENIELRETRSSVTCMHCGKVLEAGEYNNPIRPYCRECNALPYGEDGNE